MYFQARVISVGTALPPLRVSQHTAHRLLEGRYKEVLRPGSVELLRRVFAHPSVTQRHVAAPAAETVFDENPDARVERFAREAVALSSQALTSALADAGIGRRELGALVVNTCTGYLCPGISTYLLEALDLPRELKVYDLVGSGCGGAIPNLEVAARACEGSGRPTASVSVEISSAAFRMGDDPGLIVSNALFGDGASAWVLAPRGPGLRLLDSRSHHAPEHREDVRFIYKDGQLSNQITPRLPELCTQAAGTVVGHLLGPRGLRVADVPHWAVHPGGERILQALERGLGLSPRQLAASRAVLARCGNLSSATVGFVLSDLLADGIAPGEPCVVLSFGAGLSAHAVLLERVRETA
jgi:predicted naringenin-chalcone synthase